MSAMNAGAFRAWAAAARNEAAWTGPLASINGTITGGDSATLSSGNGGIFFEGAHGAEIKKERQKKATGVHRILLDCAEGSPEAIQDDCGRGRPANAFARDGRDGELGHFGRGRCVCSLSRITRKKKNCRKVSVRIANWDFARKMENLFRKVGTAERRKSNPQRRAERECLRGGEELGGNGAPRSECLRSHRAPLPPGSP